MSKCEQRIALETAQKEAMRAKDKLRLGVIRMILAEVKRIEVDERIELDDARILATMDKMLKQRRDSIAAFRDAGRDELVAQEEAEVEVLQSFLPAQLTSEEISQMISAAIADTGAENMKDMGKVMGVLKAKMQGRADMGAVSALIKKELAG